MCCPATIAGFITSRVVDAIDGLPWRTLAHIDKEVGEGQPSLANGDALAAILPVAAMALPHTSRDHVVPRLVGRGLPVSAIVAVTVLAVSNTPGGAHVDLRERLASGSGRQSVGALSCCDHINAGRGIHLSSPSSQPARALPVTRHIPARAALPLGSR